MIACKQNIYFNQIMVIHLNSEQIKNEISRLDLSEKLLLVEDVWDSIATGEANIPMSTWQKQELDRRYVEYKTGQVELHDWAIVHKDLRDQHK